MQNTIKNHLGWNIHFDKYVCDPAQVPKSAAIVDCYYDEQYNAFTLYKTKSGVTYARHTTREVAAWYKKINAK